MFAENKLTEDFREVRDFLMNERDKVLSEAEWRFRMRGFGYNLKKTDDGIEVARLPRNEVLGVLAV